MTERGLRDTPVDTRATAVDTTGYRGDLFTTTTYEETRSTRT
ncbi:MAG: hypothetical protein ACRDN9_20705 [Streptosporangiaceae bacterium]